MQEFIGKRVAERFQHALRVFAARNLLERLFDFMATHAVGMVTQSADRGHGLARFQPVHEVVDAHVDDGFGFRRGLLAIAQTFLHDLREIVHAVQKDVVQIGNFRLHVARHGKVDHEHRAVLAQLDRAFHHAEADDGQLAGRAGDDDIVISEMVRQIGEQDGLAIEALREQ